MSKEKQTEQMTNGGGFVAALDQSGGSTPKALALYGVEADAYNGEAEMFDQIHAMRTRIIKSDAFTGARVVGAILFEMTMDRDVDGVPTAQYLWDSCGVVPFLKIDKGLADEANGVQLMKPIDGLDTLLEKAVSKGIFGTKMRSVINQASSKGIKANVAQQFELAGDILAHGLMPIVEPEININMEDKSDAEDMLRDAILASLDMVPEGQQVMLKLTLPEAANQYKALVDHPKVMRVVALSGGYNRDEANRRLSENSGMIASFSRALTEGLSAQQSEAEFDATLDASVGSIHAASVAG
ncbi:fructose bisphosphate aldolase [Halocynthiibacter styelae]|uniref:fructose-bisphosphate aldolase n=1 Tax=Halocynthiibacter styelae TaxID=2761955 RepID=A0A8J7ID65_9RHOB|nr:fructose bisphosphate aldolase [Paenihalocynthiibacter styelae]MBI1494113.1 fructose bisphosphate aldolase [Paenihalocynthiibacter styelae]